MGESRALAWALLLSTDPVCSLLEPGECGGLYMDGKGKIINYIGPETECVWTFKLDPDLKLYVELKCNIILKEYVEVFDGPPGSKSLGRMCNAYSTFIASSSNIITVKYSRIPSHPPSFFEVYYFPKSY
uniref:Spermadhesin family member n=1 Tax=Prolemur simus TaxID=1328070 RepID=A0A8C8Z8V0_PROSS